MSKISFHVNEKGISIVMEPERAESRSARPFIDKFGNVWKAKEFENIWCTGGFYEFSSNTAKNNFRVVETELSKYE